MPRVTVTRSGHVATLVLDSAVINALNPALVGELRAALAELRNAAGVRAAILASANDKFFCIGFDLPRLLELTPGEMEGFYGGFVDLCLELYTLPVPTVAALTGHATAGGCIVALCCDYRLIAGGHRLMGLNEVRLGLPLPLVADCILRQLVGVQRARAVTDLGRFYPPDELAALGLVDRVLPVEEVRGRALEQAGELAAMPRPALALIKRNRIGATIAEITAGLDQHRARFLACWHEPASQALLRAAAAQFRR